MCIIHAFGMSFFALHAGEKETIWFSNPFWSGITTARMMVADFGAIDFKTKDYFEGALFFAFVIFLSVILLNLLNALAISDTNEMIKIAESVETAKRIATIRKYEKLFSAFKQIKANVFPELNMILLKPNEHRDNNMNILTKTLRFIEINRKHTTCPLWGLTVKTGNEREFENANWMSRPVQTEFDEKFIDKIVTFVKKRQEKDSQDKIVAINLKEFSAMREDIQMLKTSSQHGESKVFEANRN